jgi:DNA-binding LacI/PurR family transcriptional regulator
VPKQVDIAANLRRAIRSGTYKPGARLPTVRELTASTGAGLPTVHRAITTLVDQGFLTTDGRNGTHVVDYPPHRHRFGLVMPECPDATGRYAFRLPQALADAATAVGRPDRRIAIHYGINQHPELPEHRALIDELAAGTLAGVILLDPSRISAWIGGHLAGVPVVAAGDTSLAATARFSLDQQAVVRQALDAVTAGGRRRLAFLGDANAHTLGYLPLLRDGCHQRGLELPPARVRAVSIACPAWAAQAVVSLWDTAGGPPPDALIVLDDNLVEDAIAGLRMVGATDVLLVHLANFPCPPADWRPLVRIGWDQRETLDLALGRLVARRGVGDIVPPLHVDRSTT